MRKVKDVLRLHWKCGLSARQIALSLKLARSTVAEYLRRAKEAKLRWPLPDDMDDGALEGLLFPRLPVVDVPRIVPDWSLAHQELRRKGVTLFLLWQEYKERCPDGYQYSRFCDLYRDWAGRQSVWMRQTHKAGEKMFVDYAGTTVPVQNPETGQVRQAQVFVAVLGASNYTFAEATWSQSLADWVGSHVRAIEYFQGSPALVVPDNLRSGVSYAHLYEPELNTTYAEMLSHYGAAALPTRIRHPRDNAKAENGVQVTLRWILARLRHRTFFSLSALNAAIAELLENLNTRPFRKLPGCRRSLWESLDRPALGPLPAERYEFAEWGTARVNIDYHIEADGHYYSVPYQLVRRRLDIRMTARTVECFWKGRRVASHARSAERGRHSTIADHMPKSHQAYLEWTPERLARWAGSAGPSTRQLVETIMATRAHPQQGYRSCLGIMRLGKIYGLDRLEAAAGRALRFRALSYRSVASILKSGLDRHDGPPPTLKIVDHPNIRGAAYFEESSC